MQQYFDSQHSIIAAVLTLLVTSLFAAVVRNRAPGHWLVETLRIVFSAGYSALGDPRKVKPLVSLVFFAFALSHVTACQHVNTKVLTADSSDAKHWPLCLEFTEDAGPVQAWQLACGDVHMTPAELEKQIMQQHPKAIVVREVRK